MMPLASRDAILNVSESRGPVPFFVPEWKNEVLLRQPSANDRDAWEIYCRENKDKSNVLWRAQLASILLCDENGQRLFTTPEQIRQLGEHSAAAIHRIWERGLELMSISDMEVTELEKN